ncbi:MAG: cyclic nucleotide-binding domain-containing protein [Hyphomicrobium sp.]
MADGGPFNFDFLESFGVPLKRVRAGEVLFEKGEPGDSMYLVLEGRFDVRLGDKTVDTVGLYAILGEMALIDAAPRSATAVAATAGEVAIIDRQTFLDLVRENPSFSLYVMRRMASRVRKMNEGA